MKFDLQMLGVPIQYREQNPFQLNVDQRLDAFPARGEPDGVNTWMNAVGDSQALPHVAWYSLLQQFVRGCESRGLSPFVLPTDRRNADERVRSLLQPQRRRIRNYLDRLDLLQLPVFKTERQYKRLDNSWWLTSAVQFHKFGQGMDVGKALELDKRWTRTFDRKYRSTVTWHKWIQWGVSRVGWSANSSQCWLWYEIRCPDFPGSSGNPRQQDQAEFDRHVDDLWLPLVHNIRWWSTSNPKVINF